jgi:hypothetical protein
MIYIMSVILVMHPPIYFIMACNSQRASGTRELINLAYIISLCLNLFVVILIVRFLSKVMRV